jgi:hypothetical protein
MSFKASPSPESFLACSYSFRKYGDQLARLPPRHGSRRRALPDWWRDDPGLRGEAVDLPADPEFLAIRATPPPWIESQVAALDAFSAYQRRASHVSGSASG